MAEPSEAAVDRDRRSLFSIGRHTVRRPRGPRRYFDDITAGYALYPLIILFGLNAVDELDRTVFGVLGPEIRDHFGLNNQGYLTLIALTHSAGSSSRSPSPTTPTGSTGRGSRWSGRRRGPCSASSPVSRPRSSCW